MAMNREQKRAMQRAGQLNADGSQAPRDRKAPAQNVKSERTKPLEFVREVRAEMRKVSWPDRQEVIRYSMIVLVALVIFTAGVFVVDYAFGELFRIILDPGNSTSGAAGLLTPPGLY
ncbi:MAG TPA: preprotein translocase subunit SecE [Microthrixaceae bacterium]|nr:preprotein translocase subunit SecE [Microthrixaceae bacterium]